MDLGAGAVESCPPPPPVQQGYHVSLFRAPYGFYPPPPLPGPPPPMGFPFQGHEVGMPHQHQQYESRPRQNQIHGPRPRGPAPRQRAESNRDKEIVHGQDQEVKLVEEPNKVSNVTCYNCA
jgi:hypothetical protein